MASKKLTTQFDPYQEMENYLEKAAVSMFVKNVFTEVHNFDFYQYMGVLKEFHEYNFFKYHWF